MIKNLLTRLFGTKDNQVDEVEQLDPYHSIVIHWTTAKGIKRKTAVNVLRWRTVKQWTWSTDWITLERGGVIDLIEMPAMDITDIDPITKEKHVTEAHREKLPSCFHLHNCNSFRLSKDRLYQLNWQLYYPAHLIGVHVSDRVEGYVKVGRGCGRHYLHTITATTDKQSTFDY